MTTMTKNKIVTACIAFCAVFIALATTSKALIVNETNSLVVYSYDDSSVFIPGPPSNATSGSVSTFYFVPTSFYAEAISSGGFAIDSSSGVVGLGIDANPGFWFDDSPVALDINASVTYALAAPTGGSTAGVYVALPFTVKVTEVDGAALATAIPALGSTVAISPTNWTEISGPGSFLNSTFTGAVTLNLSTLKSHYGLGPAQNITGLRLQLSPTVTAWTTLGTARIDIVNANIGTAVTVPEPSTYALLALGAGAVGVIASRRRRKDS